METQSRSLKCASFFENRPQLKPTFKFEPLKTFGAGDDKVKKPCVFRVSDYSGGACADESTKGNTNPRPSF